MQNQLIAGDTLNYRTQVLDYLPTDGWVLKLRLAPRSSGVGAGAPITLTATSSGDVYTVQASASVTATWSAGNWAWSTWVEKAGERYTVASGQILIVADPSAMAAGSDTRSHAQKVLDSVEAVIEGRATQAHAEYQINGRMLKFLPLTELLALRDRYRWEVRSQQAAASGLPGPGKLQVRL